MSEVIQVLRAYRPSFAAPGLPEDGEEAQRQKEANMKVYTQRAVRGLPLFVETDSEDSPID